MRRTAVTVLAAGQFAFAPPAAACPDPRPLDADPKVLAELTDWIAAHAVYDTPARTREAPPAILACASGETIRYEGEDVVVEGQIRAAYGALRRRIFIVAPWSPDNPEDLARLLHELVHDVQFLEADWPCPQAAEAEAYRLTALWMEEQGLDPGFDWFEVYLHSRCPNDVHP